MNRVDEKRRAGKMNSLFVKAAKFKNLAGAYLSSHMHSTPAFVRMIPTDKCNLNCKYCWQKADQSHEMSMDEFSRYLERAAGLKVGLITFLGGEPMLWNPLYDAIALCSRKRILTDLTTNGTLLNNKSIEALGRSGLDYLNISVDGFEPDAVSSKNSVIRKNLVDSLKKARKKYRMHFRINSVIYNNNFETVKALIAFAGENNVQISLGFVVPPVDGNERSEGGIYFGKTDRALLRAIVDYIIDKKKRGYPIIDPDSYFENIFRFLDREKFWDCNYPTRYGWVNVTPNGKIRTCTKKMDELDINFEDLDIYKLKDLRAVLKEKVQECNIDCYSNCAYDSYFYTHHKLKMLKKITNRLTRQ
jgi:MoaA/NifB/PqqE/SkfB family radical SAM enzyme